MKFFIPLGYKYGEYWHLGSVQGPYKDDAEVQAALQWRWPNDKDAQFLVFDGQLVNVQPSSLEKPESEKRAAGNMDNYTKDPDGKGYHCKTCGGVVMSTTIAHPVHFKEMPGAGGGECEYEEVPWCPNCEKKPSPSGAPVYTSIG